MPGGDGTGPLGMGPMTGRAAGYCAGYPVPGYMNPVGGRGLRGFGRGRGGGRGWRNWFYATGLTGWQRAAMGMPAFGIPFQQTAAFQGLTREQQVEMLKRQAEMLSNQLDAVKRRIEELSSTNS